MHDTRTHKADPSAPSPTALLGAAAEKLLKTCVDRGVDALGGLGDRLSRRIRGWVDSLLEDATRGSAGRRAVLSGIRAALKGRNPVLAALGGLISGLSTKVKIGLAVLIALTLLLGPVLLVVLLLALLVAAVIGAIRSGD
ncbi:hypothetical protein [Rhodococcus sp. CH91]|uniref:hypothetical protein n=1 Tax=Rhodococcus sp. CH91 TaxID=2910256 RepID=UPI001F4A6189|nr:hypothetical protein [Rhodococcus sp. CH91]